MKKIIEEHHNKSKAGAPNNLKSLLNKNGQNLTNATKSSNSVAPCA